MKVAFGTRAHSGWAALVVVGTRDGDFTVVDRRRIELVDDEGAKQPYHPQWAWKQVRLEMWSSVASKRRSGSRPARCELP